MSKEETHRVLVFLCSAVHVIFFFSSYLLGLSVDHYLENVHIIMLVRFKLAEERENRCTVKKKKCVASNKSSFSLTNKNIPVKMTRLLSFPLSVYSLKMMS